MNYFSGFYLNNEEILFEKYLTRGAFDVVGFSFGAQKAVEHAYKSTSRIDKLILLSPAFFQTQKDTFVATQLKHFASRKDSYVKQFLANVSYPSKKTLEQYLSIGNEEELEALLTYKWDRDKLQTIRDKGISIEVFLGAKDKIINSQDTLAFFSEYSTSYYHKDAGHLLKNKEE